MRLKHLASNFYLLEMQNGKVYFSYETPIAFIKDGMITARVNDWGPTTGKHLNKISEKENRIGGTEFTLRLKEFLRDANTPKDFVEE